ncbi:MAG: cobalt transport protein [Clostridiales bacterium]|nr:cobalt transport protein [Clostridiales bacterium]
MRRFEDRNPIAVAVYLLAAAGVAMLTMDPVLLCLSLAGALLSLGATGGFGPLRSHGWAAVLFLLTALINPLTYHNGRTVLLVVNDAPITLEAVLYGMAAGGMIVAVLYWFRIFSRIMTGDKLLYLLGGLSPGLSLVVSMALRYVPLFGRQWRRVQATQRALGLYREDDPVAALRGRLRVFSVMTTWALENGVITADSMAARGYGLGRRTHFARFRFTLGDGLLTAASLALAGLSLWGAAGRGVSYYPAFAMGALTPRGLAGYLAYGVLVLLPALLNIKEAMVWHCFNSGR